MLRIFRSSAEIHNKFLCLPTQTYLNQWKTAGRREWEDMRSHSHKQFCQISALFVLDAFGSKVLYLLFIKLWSFLRKNFFNMIKAFFMDAMKWVLIFGIGIWNLPKISEFSEFGIYFNKWKCIRKNFLRNKWASRNYESFYNA